ncbi:MAG: ADYC domain-containing protein [Cyanobacteria bacterium P01_A01_bin.123]
MSKIRAETPQGREISRPWTKPLHSIHIPAIAMQHHTIELLLLISGCSVALTALPAQTQPSTAFEIGTTLTTSNVQGNARTIKILDADVVLNASGYETVLHTVAYQNSEQLWQPLCNPNVEEDTRAVALPGQWDSTGSYLDNNEITFACTSGVIGKCVLWGYHPQQTVEGYSLQDLHQACTRMARADYCGDGVSHTRDGTEIDIYDRLSIQMPTTHSAMAFEAAWGPDGAVWISRTRWPEAITYVHANCPERLQAEGLSPEEIQARLPNALIFNDSFVRSR